MGTQINPGVINGGQYNASPETLEDGQTSPLQMDTSGNLKVTLVSGGTDQEVITALQNPSRFTRATINITTATTTAVVGATAAQTTRIYRMVLNFAAAQTLDIRSASTSLNGAAMTFGAGGSLVLDFTGDPWFSTAANEALNFVTSTTGAITGFVDYIKSA